MRFLRPAWGSNSPSVYDKAAGGGGSASYGFDFRATSGYVTDPAAATYVIGDAYPQTRNGITFGWSSGTITTRDRSTSADPRVAGVNFNGTGGATSIFKIDLPNSGNWKIGIAFGDATASGNAGSINIKDNGSSLFTKTITGGQASNHYYDINNALFNSDALFFAGQTFQALAFSSTVCTIEFTNATSNFQIAHIDLQNA